MTPEHYNIMKREIQKIWTPEEHEARRAAIIAQRLPRDIEKRLRWDWSWASNMSAFVVEVLYTYLDDTHIDSALKKIIAELEKAASV
jgi:hypothetical protein